MHANAGGGTPAFASSQRAENPLARSLIGAGAAGMVPPGLREERVVFPTGLRPL
jgi:hypothetical protein